MAHLLAKIDEVIHKIPKIKDLDRKINAINSFFNYRAAAYKLKLKPSTSFSGTHNWRSHDRNYKVRLANFLEQLIAFCVNKFII